MHELITKNQILLTSHHRYQQFFSATLDANLTISRQMVNEGTLLRLGNLCRLTFPGADEHCCGTTETKEAIREREGKRCQDLPSLPPGIKCCRVCIYVSLYDSHFFQLILKSLMRSFETE